MVAIGGSPRAQDTIWEIGGDRFELVSQADLDSAIRGLPTGIRRAWQFEPIPLQNANDDIEFEVPLRDFSLGSGFTFADTDRVYEQANGWDATAPGRITSWARLTTAETTTSVDARGFLVYHDDHLYMLRGRYATKYAVEEKTSEWAAIERFDFGPLDTNAIVAGEPVIFDGDIYVPLKNSATNALHEWVRLSTINTHVQETQTLVLSGDPGSGTWTATYQGSTSGTIAIDASAATVQATLRLLPGMQEVTVTRSGTTPNFTYTVAMVAVGGAVGTSSPPAMTAADTFDMGSVAVNTTVAGTSDRWDRGPTHATTNGARAFAAWRHPISGPVLARGAGQFVELAASGTDLLSDANWETEYRVCDTSAEVIALGTYDRDLIVWLSNGQVVTFDSQANPIPIPDVQGIGGYEEGVGMRTWFGYQYIPSLAGLWRWRPGAGKKVGPEQEGALDGSKSSGWGKVMGLAAHGDRLYYAAQDNYNEKGIVGSFSPKPRSVDNPITPHMHFLLDQAVEDCELLQLTTQPGIARTLATLTDDNAVGTVAWTAPTEAVTVDAVGANLVANPGAETDASGWTGLLGATVARDTGEQQAGSASFKVVTPGSVVNEGMISNYGSGDFAISPSAKHTYSVYVKASTGTPTMAITATTLLSIGGAGISVYQATFTASTAWQRVTLRFTSDATAAGLRLTVRTVSTAQAITFYADGFEVIQGQYAYASGGTTHYLKGVSIDGVVPTGSTINGIQLDVYKRQVDVDNDTTSIIDSVVSLVKAGTVSGDNKATATQWPTGSFAIISYGGPTDLWGDTWAASDFGTTFGAVVSAAITQGQAQIDGYLMRIYYTTAGTGEPGVLLAVLTVDETRTIATPYIYQLPRAGLTPGNDPNVAKLDAAETPELEVWASVDESADFQLDSAVTSTGFHRFFFPATTAAVGRYCQLVLKAGGREFRTARYANPGREIAKTWRAVESYLEASLALGVTVRDTVLRGSYRVDNGKQHTLVVRLEEDLRFADMGMERRTVEQLKADLVALNGRETAPVPFRAGDSSTGYCEVVSATLHEVTFKQGEPAHWLGIIRLREAPYE